MLPFFYHSDIRDTQVTFTLDEATSKHCIQVLRMGEGEHVLLTDGKGNKADVVIVAADRKRCGVQAVSVEHLSRRPFSFSLGIAFTKNNSRNEWLLEKATELGIEHIQPLISSRTEKEKFNIERLNNILIAAMLQSQQSFLPVLHEPVPFRKFVTSVNSGQKLMAHCIESEERTSLLQKMQAGLDTLMLVGPEGDFTKDEVTLAIENGFAPVSLGSNRLRTETAGLYVCTVFNALNYA
jgi:16S rRNA (uracil1498-N3)-methyltransferase